jgi:hypothetical protein
MGDRFGPGQTDGRGEGGEDSCNILCTSKKVLPTPRVCVCVCVCVFALLGFELRVLHFLSTGSTT